MPNLRITDLTSITAVQITDVLPVVNSSFFNNNRTTAQISVSSFGNSLVNRFKTPTFVAATSSFQPAIGGNTASGMYSSVLAGCNNVVTGNCSVIVGGDNNQVSGTENFIGGGIGNSIQGTASQSIIPGGSSNIIPTGTMFASINGGCNNTNCGYASVLNGGAINYLIGSFSVINGGCNNTNCGGCSVIGGGSNNIICSNVNGGGILGGSSNLIGSSINNTFIIGSNLSATTVGLANSTVVNNLSAQGVIYANGGTSDQWNQAYNLSYNTANTLLALSAAPYSVNTSLSAIQPLFGWGSCAGGKLSNIGGGCNNTICNIACYANINGGTNNIASAGWTVVGGGAYNAVCQSYSVVVGGCCNTSLGNNAFIGNGCCNTNSGFYTFIGNGNNNTSSAGRTFIGNGKCNTNSGFYTFIGNGKCNTNSGNNAFIGSGCCNCNTNSGAYAFIGNGCCNTNSGVYAFIGSGSCNTNSGAYAFIAAGCNNNTLAHNNTFILGSNLSASQANYTYVNNLSVQGNVVATGTACVLGNITSTSTISALGNIITRGSWFNSVYTGVSGDGVLIDYLQGSPGLGRISVGNGTGSDSLAFYANGPYSVNNTPTMYLSANGYLGVGTTEPTTKLHLGSDTTSLQLDPNWDNTGNAYVFSNGAGYLWVGTSDTAPLGFYTNSVSRLTIDNSGNISALGNPLQNLSYISLSGGSNAVTQSTSRTTAVTLNAPMGSITLYNAVALAGQLVNFTFTNSFISANDHIVFTQINSTDSRGWGSYNIAATPTAGSATVYVRTLSAAEAGIGFSDNPTFKYTVIKSAS